MFNTENTTYRDRTVEKTTFHGQSVYRVRFRDTIETQVYLFGRHVRTKKKRLDKPSMLYFETEDLAKAYATEMEKPDCIEYIKYWVDDFYGGTFSCCKTTYRIFPKHHELISKIGFIYFKDRIVTENRQVRFHVSKRYREMYQPADMEDDPSLPDLAEMSGYSTERSFRGIVRKLSDTLNMMIDLPETVGNDQNNNTMIL